MIERYDLLVLGGGPAGYVAALHGRRLGLTVALIEKERVGGVCLNRGCIPTKALLADVEGLEWVRRSAKAGILKSVPDIDFGRLMERKSAVVNATVTNLEKHLAHAGVDVISGTAEPVEPGVVSMEGGRSVYGTNVILATGSRSWKPPIPGIELPGVLTTRQILELDHKPQSLTIIGGGAIGQEFAVIFNGLGSKVTILEALPRILNDVDEEIGRKYATIAQGRGIGIEVGVIIHGIEKTGDQLRVIYEKKGREKTVESHQVLGAAGRRPVVEGVGLEKVGIHVQNNAVAVDAGLKTSVPGIFAAGDVIGKRMLAHVAYYHGEIAAENAAGGQRRIDERPIPSCVFTSPQIAWVGLTEQEAAMTGKAHRTSVFSLSANGKAVAVGEPRGWVKLIEDTGTGRLVGAHILGPQASELIGEMTVSITMGLSAADVCSAIHPHPTLSEALKEAALGFLGGPIHAVGRVKEVKP
ncbi:MAG: dihydrolipoyl dehydrogenase [Pseudomonadota bacterium]